MSSIPSHFKSIEQSLKRLKPFLNKLLRVKSESLRLEILSHAPEVVEFLDQHKILKDEIQKFNLTGQYILKSILVLGQGDLVFHGIDRHTTPHLALKQLLEKLEPVEKFYDKMGGIIGYHITMLRLILEKGHAGIHQKGLPKNERFLKPPGHDLSKETPFVRKAIKNSLEKMAFLAEIYPVGGAGDRLNLHDEKTGEDLPSAELLYEGRTLLEGLIRDLQAREYLHFKLFGKQILVPIAMMTSDEKNNESHILAICEKQRWFGRPKDSYVFFKQPLVPVLTEQGNWAVSEPMKLFFKPGGHGVLWKKALDSGVIAKLLEKGCTKALVRQINNPAAGTDYGLLAFCGCGFLSDQIFGFASCPRLLKTAEGMNVLVERQKDEKYEYSISNIEYPDFVKKHIKDESEMAGSKFSVFPANTNILFVDLKSIQAAVDKCPIPGMLINMKTKVTCLSAEGKKREFTAGRLESLMQNIADVMTKHFSKAQEGLSPETLPTFLTYNARLKTISVTKKLHTKGESIVETPEGCYFDQLQNHYELFTVHCGMNLPKMASEDEYIQNGPSFITGFHPALGPLYSIIAQKIQGGALKTGAEMVLEIAEVELRHVEVDGSLLIYAENIVGHKNAQGIISYSENVGRCTLRNVKIVNRGIDRKKTNLYWKGQVERHEALRIQLKGQSEFFAENVSFSGNIAIEVPDGYRMTARQHEEKVVFATERLHTPQQRWAYSFDDNDKITLRRQQ